LFLNWQTPVYHWAIFLEMATCIKTTETGYYPALSLDVGDDKIFPAFVDDRTEMFQPIATVICKFTFILCVVITENMARARTFGLGLTLSRMEIKPVCDCVQVETSEV
jgi:hypothetical protein